MHPVNIAYSRLCFAVVIPYIPHSPTPIPPKFHPRLSSEVILLVGIVPPQLLRRGF